MTRFGPEWEAHLRVRGMLKEEPSAVPETKPDCRTLEGEYRGVPFVVHSLEHQCGETGSIHLHRGKLFAYGFPSLEAGEKRVRLELNVLAVMMAASDQ